MDNLTNGMSYTFNVRMRNAVGLGGASNSVTAMPVNPSATPPDAIANLYAVSSGENSVDLTWSEPDNNGSPIIRYEITWTSQVGGPLLIPASATGYTVTGLTTGTSYTFDVRAVNAGGTGGSSNPASGVPSGPPSAPVIQSAVPGTGADLGKVTLTWTAPADLNGSTISGYVVYRDGVEIATLGTGVLTHIDATGAPGVEYSYTVAANSANGKSPESAAFLATPRGVPQAPTDIVAEGTGTVGEVTVSWSAPLNTGGDAITTYTVYWSGNNGTSGNEPNIAGTGLTMSLVNGVEYTFTVSAHNPHGEGPRSGPATAMPYSGPGAPTLSTAEATKTSGEVKLTWTAPGDDGGSPLQGYEYSSDDGGAWHPIPGSNGLTTEYVVPGLSDGVSYTFKVRAVNVSGPGEASNSSTAKPYGPPGAPTILSVTGGNGTVTLAWGHAPDGGSDLITYEISWTGPTDGDGTVAGTEITYTASGLTNGETYTFEIYAVNDAGDGPTATETATPNYLRPVVTSMTPPAGPDANPAAGGATVAIAGENFIDGKTTVMFGEFQGTVVSVSPDGMSMNVTTPAGYVGSTVPVVVSTPGGTAVESHEYTYDADPGAPAITNIDPSSGVLAGGETVTITGTNLTKVRGVLFGVVPAPNFNPTVDDNTLQIIVPEGLAAGDVQIVLQYDGGGMVATGVEYTYEAMRENRPDPSKDPEVIGLMNAQVQAAERHYRVFATFLDSRLSVIRSENGSDARKDVLNFKLNLPSYQGMSQRDRFFAENTPGCEVVTTSVGAINLTDLKRSSDDCDSVRAALSPCLDKRWAVWLDGAVNFGKNDDNDLDLDHVTLGVTLGADYAFTDRFIAGFALGYSNDKTDVGKNGTESRSDAYTGALYASYALSSSLYLQGAVGYSGLDMDSKRYTATGFADGNRDGSQYFASVLLGWEKRILENFVLSPFGRFEAVHTTLDGFTEKGSTDPLRYGKTDIEMYAGSLGLKGRYSFLTSWGSITPSAGVEYTYNLKDTTKMALGYADTGIMPYSLTATSVGQNTFTATAGVEARIRDNLGVGLNYRGSFANDRNNHSFNLQFNLAW